MNKDNDPGYKTKGAARLFNATGYSLKGLRVALSRETAFRQEFILCVILIPLAFWWGRSATERILLITTCLVVLIVELVNSALEAVVDRIGTEHHELSGLAKDYGSAAVFISLILVLVVWTMVGVNRWL